MATTHQYLVYTIHITDLALITQLQGSLHPVDGDPTVTGNGIGAILAAPDDAAVKYSTPKLAPRAKFTPPCITSGWFGTEDHFPTNVATFDRKSGGWFGIPFLFGDTTHYHWRGIFVYAPPNDAAGLSDIPNITPRSWIDGFEFPLTGEGGLGSVQSYSREASRHVEGLGLALRGQSASVKNHLYTENGAALSKTAWDRFYIRLRALPPAATTFWRIRETVQASVGAALDISPSGQLVLSFVNSASVLSLLGTSPALALDTWYRVDVLSTLTWDTITHINGLTIGVYLNGTAVVTGTKADSGSISGTDVDRWGNAEIGTLTANSLALDVDDWHGCAAHPTFPNPNPPPTTLDPYLLGVEWINGSGIFAISPTGLDGTTTPAAWTGDYRTLLQNPPDDATATVTSATASAALVVNTDALEVISARPENIGCVAINVAIKATTVQAGAQLGIVTADAGLTGTLVGAIAQLGGNWMQFLWKFSGTRGVKPSLAVNLMFNHGAAGATTIKTLMACAEIMGAFGPEDTKLLTPPPSVMPTQLGMHNAPYPSTPWARLTTPPIQPVFIRSGTYAGNNVGIDLLFPVPIHFIMVRPLTGDTGGWRWFTSMLAPHHGLERRYPAHHMVDALIDPTFVPAGLDTQQQQTIVRIAGNDSQSNATGVTYAYLAIGDPGMRFLLNGCIKDHRLPSTTVLKNTGFTPLAGFFFQESGADATAGAFYKGPGHAPASISPLGAAEQTNSITFTGATLVTQAGFQGPGNDIAFALMRMDDNSGNAGKVAQIGKYTGDGNASRSIALAPASGKRPVWAIIVPHNANAIYRDAQNTTVNSQQFSAGANTATGITGGDIDQINVGITLNAAGVVYDYLVFPGDSVAGNGGFSIAGDFFPVPPDAPPGSPTDDGSVDHAEPPDAPIADPDTPVGPLPDPLPPVGPMPSLTDDLDVACEPDTRRIANIALTRIGIGKQIANIATDQTREAVAIRLVYNDAIQETLRDFAWPFATRYVQLAVLDGGVRPNSDWLYKYRQPSDCLFERRLVVNRTDVGDPAPSPFLCSSDDTGGLIFANLANAVLEYTARPKCPHTRGEPLFREAAAWKLAELIAPSLSRMTNSVELCQKGYAEAIAKASLVLRPGIPGEVPAAATVDTTAAAKRANLDVINLALIRIGARTIRNTTTDQSREAQMARSIFEQELRATLRDYPWAFATVYTTPTLIAGTSTVPVNADWQYSYRLPADAVFVRRVLSGSKRAYDRNPPTFKLARDASGGLLFTDTPADDGTGAQPIVIEYTNRQEAAVLNADPLFRDALGWRLAWSLAPSLAMIIPETPETVGRGPEDNQIQRIPRTQPSTGMQLRQRAAEGARQCYYFALATAMTAAANEDQPDIQPVDSDWINGRN